MIVNNTLLAEGVVLYSVLPPSARRLKLIHGVEGKSGTGPNQLAGEKPSNPV
jgi:hypothetical protein